MQETLPMSKVQAELPELSEADAKEKIKSQHWRLNNLYWIIDKSGQRVKFKMNWAQIVLFRTFWYLNIILKARQLGCTTMVCLFMLDICLFYPNTTAAIIAHHEKIASKIFEEKIHFPYKNLPAFLKAGAIENFKTEHESMTLLKLGNNSSIMVGTTLRGGTYQYLLITEYGKICAKFPDKAKEIRTGALNTVAAGQYIWIESTAEGSDGHFFELCKQAQDMQRSGAMLSRMDYRFFFFPWWKHPEYELADEVAIDQTSREYFEKLESEIEEPIRPAQRAWYVKKAQVQQDDMLREYPSTPDEAFKTAIQGAYYSKQMTAARQQGRIAELLYNPENPVHVGFDLGIGQRDAMTLWCFQVNLPYIDFINYYENQGENFGHYVKWLIDRGYNLGRLFVPHDVKKRDLFTGLNTLERAKSEYGLDFEMIPRAADLMEDIRDVRRSFYRFRICTIQCVDGIKCLDHYRKEWNEKLEAFHDRPLKNWAIHGADGFRTCVRGINDWLDPTHLEDVTEPAVIDHGAGAENHRWML